jgi:hypothetical protein
MAFPAAPLGGAMMIPTDDFLPPELATLVDDELASGERIVWVGQPIPSRYAFPSLGIVLFAIPWTAFAIFWMAAASGFKLPDLARGSGLFSLFGVPFVLIGLGMLSTPFWMLRKARRTAYVITDQRALVVDCGAWGRVSLRSFEPAGLTDLRRDQ